MSQAEKRKFEFDVMQVQWLRKATEVLRGTLIRARAKETPGSEVYVFRGREIEALTVLLQVLS